MSKEPIGESSVDICQLANVRGINWRKYSGHSPIGEFAGDKLAKVPWTLAIGESPICESLIGEVPVTRFFLSFVVTTSSF